MDVVSYNVNSIRARGDRVGAWLDRTRPHVVCLQETKVVDADFPRDLFESRGYDVHIFGQPSYNGVAIATQRDFHLEAVTRGFRDDTSDDQCRCMAGTIGGLRLINAYVPNGSEVDSEKYEYKLGWLQRFVSYLKAEMAVHAAVLVVGDFNVAPDDRDLWDPVSLRGSIMCSEAERQALRRLVDLGLTDAYRHCEPEGRAFTWWDYRSLAFPKNRGWRIDLALASDAALSRVTGVRVDREERKGKQPSDHAPLWVTLGD